MKKRILALLFSACLCLLFAITAFASGDAEAATAFSTEKEYMSLVILQNSGIEVTPTESYELLDISGNPTIICVEFTHGDSCYGFGLIDLTSYTVTMYALDAVVPFDADDMIVSDGILSFAKINEDGNTAIDLNTQDEIPLEDLFNDFREELSVVPQEKRESIIESMANAASTVQVTSSEPILVAGGSDESLVYSAGNNSGSWNTDCGINAAAMYLRHMDEYFDSSYVYSTHTTESKLKSALASLANSAWSQTTNLTMTKIADLTNLYLDKYGGSSTTDVSNSSYTWSSYKNRINNGKGKPCILFIGANKTSYWSSNHAVVGVGYTSGATSTSGYAVVNSGWVSLKYVQIATSIPGYIIK